MHGRCKLAAAKKEGTPNGCLVVNDKVSCALLPHLELVAEFGFPLVFQQALKMTCWRLVVCILTTR